jgi:hypothetical protein
MIKNEKQTEDGDSIGHDDEYTVHLHDIGTRGRAESMSR